MCDTVTPVKNPHITSHPFPVKEVSKTNLGRSSSAGVEGLERPCVDTVKGGNTTERAADASISCSLWFIMSGVALGSVSRDKGGTYVTPSK